MKYDRQSMVVAMVVFLLAGILLLAWFPPAVRPDSPGVPPITDMSNRAVPLVRPVRKALILPVILSGYVTIDEGAEHVLAVSKPARDLAVNGLMGRVYPAVEHLPLMGATVAPADPERIILLNPDAVFVWAEQAEPLRNIGLPVLVEVRIDSRDQGPSRLAMWKLMGSVADKPARAEGLLARYFAKYRELKALLPAAADGRLRVAVLYRTGDDRWAMGGKYYNMNDRLEAVGASNVAREFANPGAVSLEQLLVFDPDVILLNSGLKEDHPPDIFARPEWQVIRAVRERRVYKMPVYSYMNAVINAPVEDPLLLLWLAEVFYPAEMPRRLRAEFRATYQEVYQYTISDEEIDQAIFLPENLPAAGYERFIRTNGN